MSALYASVQGERGTATKCGHKFLSVHIRGLNLGIKIDARHDDTGDSFVIYQTNGRNGRKADKYLLEINGNNTTIIEPWEELGDVPDLSRSAA